MSVDRWFHHLLNAGDKTDACPEFAPCKDKTGLHISSTYWGGPQASPSPPQFQQQRNITNTFAMARA